MSNVSRRTYVSARAHLLTISGEGGVSGDVGEDEVGKMAESHNPGFLKSQPNAY